MTTFQLLAIPACVLFACVAVMRRRTLLTRRQSMSWVVLWATAAIVIALPDIASRVAHVLGIGRGADLVLYVMCFVSVLCVMYFYHKQRRLEISLTELVRHEALQHAFPGRDLPEAG